MSAGPANRQRRPLLTPPSEPKPLRLAPDGIRPDPDAEGAWVDVKAALEEIGVPDAAMVSWIEPLRPLGRYRGSLAVEGPQVATAWVAIRYGRLIGELLRDAGSFDGLRLYDRPPTDEGKQPL